MKNKNTIPGMKIPALLIWLYGFLHKLLKTAAIDADTGLIVSSYITNKSNQYEKYVSVAIIKHENCLKAVHAEAAELLLEERLLAPKLAKPVLAANDASVQEKHEMVSQVESYLAAEERHKEILNCLMQIKGRIESAERITEQDLKTTAAALRARMATYTHGATLRPVFDRMIPQLGYQTEWERYRSTHQGEYEAILRLTNAVDEEE